MQKGIENPALILTLPIFLDIKWEMKPAAYFLIVIITLLTACAGARPAPDTSEAQKAGHRETAKGNDWFRKGCHRSAWESFLRAHRHFVLAGDPVGEAMALNNMGTVYRATGDISGALVLFDEAVALHRHLPEASGLLQSLSNRAAALIDDNRLEEAAGAIASAQQVADRLKIPFSPLRVNQGIYYRKKGDFEAAKKFFETAVQTAKPRNFGQIATAQSALGNLLLDKDQTKAALPHLAAALEADRASGNLPGIADDLAAIGNAYIRQGDIIQGVDYLKRGLLSYAAMGDKKQAETILVTLEKICREADCRLEGIRHLATQYLEGPLSQGLCD